MRKSDPRVRPSHCTGEAGGVGRKSGRVRMERTGGVKDVRRPAESNRVNKREIPIASYAERMTTTLHHTTVCRW